MNLLPPNALKKINGNLSWTQLTQLRYEDIEIWDEDGLIDRLAERPVKCQSTDGNTYIAISINSYHEILETEYDDEIILYYTSTDDYEEGTDSYQIKPVIIDDELVYFEQFEN